jgi:hypothetical protein
LLGCFGALWSQKSATLLGMTAPVMALSVPLVDMSISVVRGSSGVSPFSRPTGITSTIACSIAV